MSVGAFSMSEMALAGQTSAPKTVAKPTRNRLVTAKSDQIQSPEPR